MNQLTVMSKRLALDETELNNVLAKTIMPSNKTVSPEQLTTFLAIANEYQLNPLAKEVYAFPAQGGGIQPVVSVDGWLKLINNHPEFDGIEIEFSESVCEVNSKTVPEFCTVRMYRKDRTRPIQVTEYMVECFRNTDPWKQKPRRMLQHKAVIQCARYAFAFAGIMEPDEAERITETPEHDVLDDVLDRRQEKVINEPVEEIDLTKIKSMFETTLNAISDAYDLTGFGDSLKSNPDFEALPPKDKAAIRNLYRTKLASMEEPSNG